MLTYRLQRRLFRIVEGPIPGFPSPVRIEMQLGPPTPFGLATGGGLTATQNTKAQSLINANTGRSTIKSETAFPPVDVEVNADNMAVEIKGDILAVEIKCESVQELQDIVETVYHIFPALLNIDFEDPPVVLRVFGSIGVATKFRWELAEIQATAGITNTERQQMRITEAVERMLREIAGGRNRRLVAAAHYFHVACRLLAAGDSPWEFMGEVVLNFAKTLQALFGQQGDDVRAGLRGVDYPAEEIESFITVMGVRDELDSGHIMLSLMDEAEAKALYTFIYGRESQFRKLLSRAFGAVSAGKLTLLNDADLTLDRDKGRLFEWIEKANRLAERQRKEQGPS